MIRTPCYTLGNGCFQQPGPGTDTPSAILWKIAVVVAFLVFLWICWVLHRKNDNDDNDNDGQLKP